MSGTPSELRRILADNLDQLVNLLVHRAMQNYTIDLAQQILVSDKSRSLSKSTHLGEIEFDVPCVRARHAPPR